MSLIDKYNVPGPRYTSYPTVPYWENDPTLEDWKREVRRSFHAFNKEDGMSIYVHLPYCESLCTFCGCNTRITVNHAVEEPYIDAVLKEWRLYLKLFEEQPNIKEIHLGGGTPTFFSPENLTRLIEGLAAGAKLDKDAELGFEANPRTTTLRHLQVMNKLGFTRLSLGIQDFDPTVQKAINRIQSFDQVKQVTDWARACGYTSINYDLVYGLPFQNLQSIENTIDLVNLLRPDRIAYYSYAHVPWVKPGQRSFTDKDLPEGPLKHAMYVRGKEMLTEAGYLEIGMDHFALPEEGLSKAFRSGSMHRNFMGYTTQHTKFMIGLGVSAISDTWTAFAQNAKVVEDYMERLAQNEFPIFRGHVLTEEDLSVRKLILDVMCQFKAPITEQTTQLFSQNQEAIQELVEDGLIRVKNGSIVVTNRGRPYVRNICMVFDSRLFRNKPDTQIFSMTI